MIGNNLDTKLEKLFENYSEEPSANCWNVVSQKLDVIMPAAASTSAAVSSGTSAFSKFIATTVGKSVAIISAISVVGVSLYAILDDPKSTEVSSVQPNTFSENKIIENKASEAQTAHPLNHSNSQPAVAKPINEDQTTVVENFVSTQTNVDKSPNTVVNHIQNVSITPKVVSVNPVVTTVNTVQTNEQPVIADDSDHFAETTDNDNPTETNKNVVENTLTESKLVFPNVFTPNGDGANDYFVIKNLETLAQQKLVVVNASGQKVFEANNYQNNWDASNVPDGAYFYMLETKIDGKLQTFYGAIQIIR